MILTVQGRSLGRRRPLFGDFSVPVRNVESDGNLTLRDLICATVTHEIKEFRKRQDDRQFLRVLTERQILDGAAAGKVDATAKDVPAKDIDVDESIAIALQAFEDGIYLVSVDDQECRHLHTPVFLKHDSRMTFIRLTLLAGG